MQAVTLSSWSAAVNIQPVKGCMTLASGHSLLCSEKKNKIRGNLQRREFENCDSLKENYLISGFASRPSLNERLGCASSVAPVGASALWFINKMLFKFCCATASMTWIFQ